MIKATATALAAAVVSAAALPLHAGGNVTDKMQQTGSVTLMDMQWQFYQGGYIQSDQETWAVYQNHYATTMPLHTLQMRMDGAAFESHAALELTTRIGMRSTMFVVTEHLAAEALVDADWPEGMAHAFAGLSMLHLDFHLEKPMIYLGEAILFDVHDNGYGYGETLAPGRYTYLELDPFPAVCETLYVLAGESDTNSSSRTLTFEFMHADRPALGTVPNTHHSPISARR